MMNQPIDPFFRRLFIVVAMVVRYIITVFDDASHYTVCLCFRTGLFVQSAGQTLIEVYQTLGGDYHCLFHHHFGMVLLLVVVDTDLVASVASGVGVSA